MGLCEHLLKTECVAFWEVEASQKSENDESRRHLDRLLTPGMQTMEPEVGWKICSVPPQSCGLIETLIKS